LIVGAGGVGGYFGGRLAQHGTAAVTFLARGAHLQALKTGGLTLHSIDGDAHIPVDARENIDDLPPFDAVVVAVKHHHLPSALQRIAPAIGAQTVVIPLLNGITATPTLQRRFPHATVLGGIAFIGSRVEQPGVIGHTAAGSLTLGVWPAGEGSSVERWLTLMQQAGIAAHRSRNIQQAAWKKMVWNCGFNAFTCLTGQWVHELLIHPEQVDTVRSAMIETIAVARAQGVRIEDTFADQTLESTRTGGAHVKTSMLQDREGGKPLELDAMNREVVRLGRAAGIPTPVNQTLCALLAPLERGD